MQECAGDCQCSRIDTDEAANNERYCAQDMSRCAMSLYQIDEYAPKQTEAQGACPHLPEMNANAGKCYFPWNSFYYTSSGNFPPCLHLIYKGGIDNLIDKEPMDVVNSKAMIDLRKSIMRGIVPEICRDAQCPFI